MKWDRIPPSITAVALVLFPAVRATAQVPPGTAPGSQPISYGPMIHHGLFGPGYQAAYRLPGHPPSIPGAPQTVTDYQSLIDAITSLPGWYGPPAPHSPPIRPQPTIPSTTLLRDDGTILWPSATPNDPTVATSRHDAEEAVRIVVQEHRKYGQATTRHVIDARNKLTAFAGQALPALKARNAADAERLERFIVELQKTLATLTVNY